jgi:hypothetical protein
MSRVSGTTTSATAARLARAAGLAVVPAALAIAAAGLLDRPLVLAA